MKLQKFAIIGFHQQNEKKKKSYRFQKKIFILLKTALKVFVDGKRTTRKLNIFVSVQYPLYCIIMNRLAFIKNAVSEGNQTNFIKINVYYQGNVGYISLRSPKDLNCLSTVMLQEISQALSDMQEDEQVNVIVFISELSHIFCAGADIKEFAKPDFDYERGVRHEPLHRIEEAFQKNRKPVIAAVNGKALGGGFELALLCDIILASEKSYFGFPEINLGLMPGIGGTQRLAKVVGEKMAMRHILTGDGFNAEEAFRANLAQKINSQNFNQSVQSFAEKIASKALTSVIIAKRAVKQSSNMTLNQGLEYERDVFYSMLNTRAAKEGVSAFVGKRKPNFKGL